MRALRSTTGGEMEEEDVSDDVARASMFGGGCSDSRHMMHWSGSVIVADVKVSLRPLVIHKNYREKVGL